MASKHITGPMTALDMSNLTELFARCLPRCHPGAQKPPISRGVRVKAGTSALPSKPTPALATGSLQELRFETMKTVLVFAFLAALVAGCGGSKNSDDSSDDPAQVEASVKAQLAKGGGGVVDLGNDPPKLVTCRKSGGNWRCTVTTAKGRSMLCLVDEDKSGRKVPPTPVCGPIDN
jgi:hypothetical protein